MLLASSANDPSLCGQPLTVSATVPSTATGTLTFSDTCGATTTTLGEVALAQTAPSSALPVGLLGCWTGDGDTIDSSSYGNNGTWEDSGGDAITGTYAEGNGTIFAR